MVGGVGGLSTRPALTSLRQHRRSARLLEELRKVRNIVTMLLSVMAAFNALRGLRRQLVVIASTIAQLEVSQILLDVRELVVFRIVAQIEVLHPNFVVSQESVVV